MQSKWVLWGWDVRSCFVSLSACLLIGLSGCETSDRREKAEITTVAPKPDRPAELDHHGYALLADLVGDEKDVSKLRFIKRERAELKALLQEIARTNHIAYETLQRFAKADASLNLKNQGLPATEIAARKAISKYKERTILSSKGKDLELQLLLSQNEALTYGCYLARVLALTEPNADRRQFLEELSGNLGKLQQRVVTMLSSSYMPQ